MISAAPRHYLTPPQVAEQLGVDPAKILAWIRVGELAAVNVATAPTGRPRWRIAQADFDVFLSRRQARPATPSPRRRKQQPEVIQFF